MALENTLLQNSISLGKITKSFESFGKGLTVATKTSTNIAASLDSGNRKKEQALLRKRELFDIRRAAVQRKERESVVEASGKLEILYRVHLDSFLEVQRDS